MTQDTFSFRRYGPARGIRRPASGARLVTQLQRWLMLCLLLVCASAQSEEAEVRYVVLQPSFVTNWGFSEFGRLKYLRTDISIRVGSSEAEGKIRYHEPQIKDALVILLSQQVADGVRTTEGREALRESCAERIREILMAEEGQAYVQEVVFENFIVQG